MKIGVLALQGGFSEHAAVLGRLGVEAVEVRTAAQVAAVDGLIIPGESTTIGKLLLDCGLLDPLRERIQAGLPVFGTCAGAIVLARDIGGRSPIVGSMDIRVRRNAFGRQLESFEESVPVAVLGDRPVRAVFIRARQSMRRAAACWCSPGCAMGASSPRGRGRSLPRHSTPS